MVKGGDLNSYGAPRASPRARPTSAPRYRSTVKGSNAMVVTRLLSATGACWSALLGYADGAAAPSPEELPGEDAGVVAVVPAEVQAVAAGELGVLDPELVRRSGRRGPGLPPGHPGVAALRAGAAGPEIRQVVVAGVAVGPDEGHTVLPVDLNVDRLGSPAMPFHGGSVAPGAA